MVSTTLAGDDDVTVPQSDAGGASRSKVAIAPIAGRPLERPRESETISLGDPASECDVLAGAVVVPRRRGLPRERVEPVDTLASDGHTTSNERRNQVYSLCDRAKNASIFEGERLENERPNGRESIAVSVFESVRDPL